MPTNRYAVVINGDIVDTHGCDRDNGTWGLGWGIIPTAQQAASYALDVYRETAEFGIDPEEVGGCVIVDPDTGADIARVVDDAGTLAVRDLTGAAWPPAA